MVQLLFRHHCPPFRGAPVSPVGNKFHLSARIVSLVSNKQRDRGPHFLPPCTVSKNLGQGASTVREQSEAGGRKINVKCTLVAKTSNNVKHRLTTLFTTSKRSLTVATHDRRQLSVMGAGLRRHFNIRIIAFTVSLDRTGTPGGLRSFAASRNVTISRLIGGTNFTS